MKRATTPTHYFLLSIPADEVKTFRLTYTQGESTILTKDKSHMKIEGNEWSLTLTQQEANLFKQGCAYAQIRVLTTAGKAYATDNLRFHVDDVEDDEVLT